MAEMKCALIKIGFIFDVARKDTQFLKDLYDAPFKTLMESGIDLSPGEIQGVIDIVKDQSLSNYAPGLAKLRSHWSDICQEAKKS